MTSLPGIFSTKSRGIARGSAGPLIQQKSEHMCLAVPGQVLSVAGEDPLERTGRVSFGGIVKEVSLSLVPEVEVGDYVIVHVGVALSKVDEEEARQVFEYLKQMDELVELGPPEPPGLQNPAAAASPSPPTGA